MLMILPGAVMAFLISIFGPAFPFQELHNNPNYNKLMAELRPDEKELMAAHPLELIDGAYSAKK